MLGRLRAALLRRHHLAQAARYSRLADAAQHDGHQARLRAQQYLSLALLAARRARGYP